MESTIKEAIAELESFGVNLPEGLYAVYLNRKSWEQIGCPEYYDCAVGRIPVVVLETIAPGTVYVSTGLEDYLSD